MIELARGFQEAPIWAFLIAFAVFGSFTALMAWLTYTRYRAYRVVRDTPTSSIRSAPQGYVELTGTFESLADDKPRHAPFSGKPCVWYRVEIEEHRQKGEDDSEWVTIFEESDPRPCVLRDDTGRCLVLVEQADMRVAVPSETYQEEGIFNDPPEPMKHVDTGLFENSLRFSEECIEPATRGYVVGRFVTSHSEDAADEPGGNVDDVVAKLEGWRDDYMAEVGGRPDENDPNPVGLTEADADRLPDAAVAWARRRGDTGDIDSVVTATGDSRQPLIVGCGGEKTVARRLFWTAFGCLAGFLLFGTGLGFVVLARFGAIA